MRQFFCWAVGGALVLLCACGSSSSSNGTTKSAASRAVVSVTPTTDPQIAALQATIAALQQQLAQTPSLAPGTTRAPAARSPQPTRTATGTVPAPSSATRAPSGTATGTVATGKLNPCLLAKADAEIELGQSVNAGKQADGFAPLNQQLCFYASTSATSTASLQLSLITSQGIAEAQRPSGRTAMVEFQDEKSLPGAEKARPIAGVGDDAFLRGPKIAVLKGDLKFDILEIGVPVASRDDSLTRLARLVVSRLPK